MLQLLIVMLLAGDPCTGSFDEAVRRGDVALAQQLLQSDCVSQEARDRALAVGASDPAVVKVLLDGGANPSVVFRDLWPLGTAASSGCLECVKLLLDAGADNAFVNGIGDTAISRARDARRFEIVRFLNGRAVHAATDEELIAKIARNVNRDGRWRYRVTLDGGSRRPSKALWDLVNAGSSFRSPRAKVDFAVDWLRNDLVAVHTNVRCGLTCGYGRTHVLEWRDGTWAVTATYDGWIS